MLTVAFGGSTISRTQFQLWYKRFKEGREYVNNIACPGRPNTLTTDENVEAMKKMILDNRRITIREVADDVGKSFCSRQAIFTEVCGMKREAAKILQKMVNLSKNNVAWTSLRRC